MLYDITHRTTYGYGSDVSVSHHLAHLHPRDLPLQQIRDFKLSVRADAGRKCRARGLLRQQDELLQHQQPA